jgi:hypothetical protein
MFFRRMILLLLPGLVSAVYAQPHATVLVSAHYDVARQSPIASMVYLKPVSQRMMVNGFLESWRNNADGFPSEEWSVFSKHWVQYALTNRLSLSTEVEFLYNRAGVAFQFPSVMQFTPGHPRLYVTPKFGVQYRIL